jgi:hypothetical protein
VLAAQAAALQAHIRALEGQAERMQGELQQKDAVCHRVGELEAREALLLKLVDELRSSIASLERCGATGGGGAMCKARPARPVVCPPPRPPAWLQGRPLQCADLSSGNDALSLRKQAPRRLLCCAAPASPPVDG